MQLIRLMIDLKQGRQQMTLQKQERLLMIYCLHQKHQEYLLRYFHH